MQVRVERETDDAQQGAEESAAAEGRWTLGFSLDLPALGPVQSEIRLHGTQVHVRLWAEQARTVQQLDAGMSHLAAVLAESGLSLQQMQCQRGMPVSSNNVSPPLLDASA
nr:flagellar hook-length control protein FliK [Oleiagrimonas sp. C23AA]